MNYFTVLGDCFDFFFLARNTFFVCSYVWKKSKLILLEHCVGWLPHRGGFCPRQWSAICTVNKTHPAFAITIQGITAWLAYISSLLVRKQPQWHSCNQCRVLQVSQEWDVILEMAFLVFKAISGMMNGSKQCWQLKLSSFLTEEKSSQMFPYVKQCVGEVICWVSFFLTFSHWMLASLFDGLRTYKIIIGVPLVL